MLTVIKHANGKYSWTADAEGRYHLKNRIYFNLGHYAREKIMTETNPQPMLVPGRNTTQNAVRPVLDDDLPF